MSAKTPIIVLHMKEIIYTLVFVGLSILLLLLLLYMFLPGSNNPESTETMKYIPGVYTSSVLFQNSALDVQVTVDQNQITDISFINLEESVSAMYPLVGPSLKELASQIIKSQSLENLSYSAETQYTSLVLINAIKTALEKASAM